MQNNHAWSRRMSNGALRRYGWNNFVYRTVAGFTNNNSAAACSEAKVTWNRLRDSYQSSGILNHLTTSNAEFHVSTVELGITAVIQTSLYVMSFWRLQLHRSSSSRSCEHFEVLVIFVYFVIMILVLSDLPETLTQKPNKSLRVLYLFSQTSSMIVAEAATVIKSFLLQTPLTGASQERLLLSETAIIIKSLSCNIGRRIIRKWILKFRKCFL